MPGARFLTADRAQPFTLVFEGPLARDRMSLLTAERFEFEAVLGARVVFAEADPPGSSPRTGRGAATFPVLGSDHPDGHVVRLDSGRLLRHCERAPHARQVRIIQRDNGARVDDGDDRTTH